MSPPAASSGPWHMREAADLVLAKLKGEQLSESHVKFREHTAKQTPSHGGVPGIIAPGATGVIYVTDRASANGYRGGDDPDWANFGQGAPETGPLPGAMPRPTSVDLSAGGDEINEYAPTAGVKELRQAVADYYNREYRQGKDSQYTFRNVCIVPGGRAGIARVCSVIGDVFVGYQVPEYTAYDALLSCFHRLVPIPSSLSEKDGYKLNLDQLRETINGTGLTAVVMSNPRNPTGQAVVGEELDALVKIGIETSTTMILDEFYSWYQYDPDKHGQSKSAAEYVRDVKTDPIVLVDGLTKNWRLPGWRCCWVVGPEDLIEAISQSGSFLDGGANHPLQLAAIPLLSAEHVQKDRLALQECFKAKRDYVLSRLDEMGLHVQHPPHATFYIWLDLSGLPEPLNQGLVFFEECLKEKVIVVPGLSFDVNPSNRRSLDSSPCARFVRLSFGPKMEKLKLGLDGIARVLARSRDPAQLEAMNKDLKPSAHPDSIEGSHGHQAA